MRRRVGLGRRRRRVHRRVGVKSLMGLGRLMRVMAAAGRRRRRAPVGMGRRRRVHRRRHMGGSAIGDFFTGVYNKVLRPTYEHVLKPVGQFALKHKLVSKGLKLIPHKGAQVLGEAAEHVGLGRRRRRRVHRGGVGGVTRLVGYGRRRRMHHGGAAMTGRLYLV